MEQGPQLPQGGLKRGADMELVPAKKSRTDVIEYDPNSVTGRIMLLNFICH